MVAIKRTADTARSKPRSKLLIKIVLALVVLVGLGLLFMSSVRDSRATPYTIPRENLRNWSLALQPASSANAPMLVLRPPPELAGGLFQQVFKRVMESMNTPADSTIPLLLKGEFDAAFLGRVTPNALMAAARSAGLDAGTIEPMCLAYRRFSQPGGTQQLYFVLFDAAAFGRFRHQIGALLGGGPIPRADFDPAALSPVLFVGLSETTVERWLPLRADAKADCIAPIVISSP